MKPFARLIVVVVALFLYGCSGCEDTASGNNDTKSNNANNSNNVNNLNNSNNANNGNNSNNMMDMGDMGMSDMSEDMGVACGEMTCAQGQECYEGFCVDPCAGTRCGAQFEACCMGQDICLGQACITPAGPCNATEDCEIDEICEPTVGRCVPRDAVEVCEFIPPVGQFNPGVDCRWTPNPGDPNQDRIDVVATPIVINLTDDNNDGMTNTDDTPDLVFLTYNYSTNCCSAPAALRIVSGDCNADGTMTTIATINADTLDNSAGIAAADLSGNGVPEIVAILRGSSRGVVAYKRDADDGSAWSEYWRNEASPSNAHTSAGAVISIADLEADGNPEIIVGNVVLNGRTGALKWDGRQTVGTSAGVGNNGFLGPSSSVGDIDLDGKLEVAAGNTLYNHDGAEVWTFQYTSNNSSCGGSIPCDGFNAMANFDADDEGEVVIVRLGEVFVFNHDGSLLWQMQIPTDNCSANESGPPTVADFDGDGRAEIGTAAADFYTVLDIDCDVDPVPAGCQSRGVLWAVPNQDCSSRVTASSVFDFEGDGKAEMVYADETTFRIFDGTDGTILYEDTTHGSHTRIEMPLVVDVDNDGNSEVIIPENRHGGGTPGVEVWADNDDNWVRTRRIWNQHGYHVTNINEDGSVPVGEQPNWLNSRLNNYRQNVQPGGIFDAPNLVIESVEARGIGCGDTLEVVIRVTVANQGALGINAGVPVRIYATSGNDVTVISDAVTSTKLLPGQQETFEVTWTVPASYVADGYDVRGLIDPSAEINECNEDDNESAKDGADIVFSSPDLIIAEVTADGTTCSQTNSFKGTVTVRNDGTQPVPANVPVVVEAIVGANTFPVTTLRTSAELAPGAEESFDYTWTPVPGAALGQNVTIRATVDPAGEVYDCDEVNTGEAADVCRIVM